ncbi:DUF2339 domain-containing protein [Fodinibius halophilus]|uniref:DUF2339 domain-containing protein n=1 Tax=Fodinibius halophilus TaxID=1736908 RepID=A0A6M1T3D8_9BACT|nr:DUF2339 domain-containing protein [Fodinibius halophilus]NGP88597.1 DUF2339 domain-containing protein [Fodinibius halophilus]
MSEQEENNLQDRVEKLEKRVGELERQLSVSEATSREIQQLETTRKAPDNASSKDETASWDTDGIQFGEEWLNRIGIGLLLIGVAFLFKYSIDQGWLIPPIRSAIGLVTGLFLFGSGIKMNAEAKPLKQILIGGGIAVFYITGFATFQLYSFVPSVIVWSFMIIVTLLALSLSVQQEEAALSIVGTLGALGTPFMLFTGEGSIGTLVIYLLIVLTGTSAIYMKKGWRSLLWSIAVGGWAVLLVVVLNGLFTGTTFSYQDKWWMQVGTVMWMLVSWLLPVIREVWPNSLLAPGIERSGDSVSSTVHSMVFMVPLFGMLIIPALWDLSADQSGIGYILMAAVGGVLYWVLEREGDTKLASSHAMMGLVMLTIGLFLILEGNVLMVVLMAEAVALRYIAQQTEDRKIGFGSHLLALIAIFWLFNLMRFEVGNLLFSVDTVSQLFVIAGAGILIPYWVRGKNIKQIYHIGTHILFLFWIYHKVAGFENGQALVTITWGAYAIILLLLGFIRFGKKMRIGGMATLFLVVGKLFLVDLSKLQAIWRILLFMGFGAVFLLLGYYGQSRWSDKSD